nr:TetR family transcriptional regulator [Streptomyces vietnamensis]
MIAESRVARSTMYVHFRTKEDLVEAYLRRRPRPGRRPGRAGAHRLRPLPRDALETRLPRLPVHQRRRRVSPPRGHPGRHRVPPQLAPRPLLPPPSTTRRTRRPGRRPRPALRRRHDRRTPRPLRDQRENRARLPSCCWRPGCRHPPDSCRTP